MGELELNFFPLEIDYKTDEGGVVVRLFGVSEDGQKVLVYDRNYSPYFKVIVESEPESIAEKIRSFELDEGGRKIKVQGVQILKIGDKNVLKVSVAHPSDRARLYAALKAAFPQLGKGYEFDIPFIKSYLIDKGLTLLTLHKVIGRPVKDELVELALEAKKIFNISTDSPKLKILGYDIETTCEGAFVNPANDPIIMVSIYSDGVQKTITWKRFQNAPAHVIFVDGELELLKEFLKIVKQSKASLLVGYNSELFDYKYLSARAAKYGLEFELGPCTLHLDIAHFVRNILQLSLQKLDLDSVARKILGKGKKMTLGPSKIHELWTIGLDQDLQILADYNLTDAQLAYELFVSLFEIICQIVKLTKLPIKNVLSATYGQLVEWYLIANARLKKQLVKRLPSKKEQLARQAVTYPGALVIEPEPGLYQDIYIFDFKSLYPTIIVSYNIDPDTINCKCCAFHGGHRVNSGLWFCSKKMGFIPGLLKELLERRSRIKSILAQTSKDDPSYKVLDARQYALKTISNSMYGYLGYPKSRWYCMRCARAVTELGKRYVADVIKEAGKFGFKILYADTDSIFILRGEKKEQEVFEFLKIINSVLPKPMELEFQGHYRRGLFLEKKAEAKGAKKRYALLREDGQLEIKGLETVRGDWSNIAKKVQEGVLKKILIEGDIEGAVAYLREIINKIKNKSLPLEDFIIEVKLTRNLTDYTTKAPHVVAAELLKNKGVKVRKGELVSYVIKEGGERISDRVVLAEDASTDIIDSDYYIEHQVMRAVYKIFELFGYAEAQLKEGQTTLDIFENGKRDT